MTLEFEIPLYSLFLMILLTFLYFSKNKVNLIENKYYVIIIISSFIEVIISFIVHLICAINDFNTLNLKYFKFINFSNKIVTTLFVVVCLSLLYYILTICYEQFRNKILKYNYIFIIFTITYFIATFFTNVQLVDMINVTNVKGSTISLSYVFVVLFLISSLVIAIINVKRMDKRFFPVFVIIPLLGILCILTLIFPGIIIYDMILVLLCYVMYFTIENPDVKMIEQLNKARDEAVKANQAKTDFLSSMSHEIRTPLNAICGFSNSLLESDGVSTEAKGDVKNIIMASDTLLELVNGILDISKIEANKLEIIDTVYSFKKMYEELILLTKARIGEKPIEFKHSYDESIPEFLYGDGIRVKQVILNLLTNSAKYTKDGYIDFRINSIQKNNIIRLIISVEDSGIGIKKESIDKLFTKFERLGVEKQTTTEGTGLGLAITKKLVEMMGGKIVVQSIYGKGSIFTISLDQRMLNEKELAKVMKEKETEEKTDEIIDASGKNVLVVDDNMLNLKVAERLLKAYKCNITLVSSGSECLEKVSSNKYDLILLDDMMPRMTGTETLQKLKEIETFKTPVVALTANAITGMKEEYINRGFNDYLSKPIVKEDLNRVMKKYLKK